MAKTRVVFNNFSGGVQRKTAFSISQDHQVRHALNCDFDDEIGTISGRLGSLRQSVVVASDPILNLFVSKIGSTRKYLVVSDDSQATPKVDVYKNGSANFAGTWTKSLEDWTTDVSIYFRNFVGKLYAFNGTDAPKSTTDYTTWSAVTNAPADGKFPEIFQQRIYALSVLGVLHNSDVANATGTDLTTTAWENVQINPQDGEQCKGLISHRNKLVIFKEDSIYRYDGTNVAGNIRRVGTHSEKGYVEHGDIYFHHPTGIYKLGGGEPIHISRPVEKYLSGMSSANFTTVASGRDVENVYFWIGNVTISDDKEFDYGTTYSNVVLKFNVYSQNWSVYTGWDARVFYFNTDDNLLHFGTSAGKIFKANIGSADIDDTTTTPIPWQIVFKPVDFGYPDKEKQIESIIGFGDYDWQISADRNYKSLNGGDNTIQVTRKGSDVVGVAIVPKTVFGKEIWVEINTLYTDSRPIFRALVFDNITLLND